MGRASVPRIVWILREVSDDAGRTVDEVIAFLDRDHGHDRDRAPDIVHRPSGRRARAVAP
ncbi:hypothetical protein ACH4FE_09115 [Streptomyces celluloflavus]|uniref:hypothetical protein n=1 Tax=Streptomyces celluloflavus TaxID=58344 RepID=UPI0037B936FC